MPYTFMNMHQRIRHHLNRIREKHDWFTFLLLVVIGALLLVLGFIAGKNSGATPALPGTAGPREATTAPTSTAPASPSIFISSSSEGIRTLSFIAPAANEAVKRGTTFKVKWEGIDFDGFAAGDLFLHPVSGGSTPLSAGSEGIRVNALTDSFDLAGGTYQWKVPADLAPGRYTLSLSVDRVFGKDDTPHRIAEGTSAVFVIGE